MRTDEGGSMREGKRGRDGGAAVMEKKREKAGQQIQQIEETNVLKRQRIGKKGRW